MTFVLYVFAYTPAKSRTCGTRLSGLPGATPPLIGWAARGTLDRIVAAVLILFFWQILHFMAIAWIYYDEYRRAGLKMLPVIDPTEREPAPWSATLPLIAASPLLPYSAPVDGRGRSGDAGGSRRDWRRFRAARTVTARRLFSKCPRLPAGRAGIIR